MAITKKTFGKSLDGKEVFLYELSNASGASMKVTDFGAILVSVLVPDREGKLTDVELGFDSAEGYEINKQQ